MTFDEACTLLDVVVPPFTPAELQTWKKQLPALKRAAQLRWHPDKVTGDNAKYLQVDAAVAVLEQLRVKAKSLCKCGQPKLATNFCAHCGERRPRIQLLRTCPCCWTPRDRDLRYCTDCGFDYLHAPGVLRRFWGN